MIITVPCKMQQLLEVTSSSNLKKRNSSFFLLFQDEMKQIFKLRWTKEILELVFFGDKSLTIEWLTCYCIHCCLVNDHLSCLHDLTFDDWLIPHRHHLQFWKHVLFVRGGSGLRKPFGHFYAQKTKSFKF